MKTKIYYDHSLSATALRDGRLRRGWTQRDIADELGMACGTYSSCENGRRRFPLQRLQLLPRDLALEVRDALVEEFATDLDRRIDGSKGSILKRTGGPVWKPSWSDPDTVEKSDRRTYQRTYKRRQRATKTLAANQAAAVD